MILIVTPSFPAKTPREFVDYLKANPGKVNWASSGVNSTPHVSLAIFTHATGVKLTPCRTRERRWPWWTS